MHRTGRRRCTSCSIPAWAQPSVRPASAAPDRAIDKCEFIPSISVGIDLLRTTSSLRDSRAGEYPCTIARPGRGGSPIVIVVDFLESGGIGRVESNTGAGSTSNGLSRLCRTRPVCSRDVFFLLFLLRAHDMVPGSYIHRALDGRRSMSRESRRPSVLSAGRLG